jgi:ABC-2 type transport system permease protein
VAYSAIFQLVSLVIPRALLAGIVYSLVWESLLGRYLPGVRYVSIRHYTTSIFVDMLDDRRYTLANAMGLRGAVLTIAITTLVCIVLATWRLRTMNLD